MTQLPIVYVAFVCHTPICPTERDFDGFLNGQPRGIAGECLGAFANEAAAKNAVESWDAQRREFYADLEWTEKNMERIAFVDHNVPHILGWVDEVPLDRRSADRRAPTRTDGR